MKLLSRTIVLALSLLVSTINAYPENIQAVKELPQVQDTLAFNEALSSDVGEIRTARSCGSCGGFPQTAGVSSNQVFSSIKTSSSPGVVHTASSYEGCSSSTGCGGVKIEDGKVVNQYGNSEAVHAASSALAGGDLKNLGFQAGLGGAAVNSVFNNNIPKNGPFWWMQENSPFSNQGHQEFHKSNQVSSSVQGGDAFASNPFLNGNINKLASSFVSTGAGSSSNSGSDLGAVNILNNPFLNGKVSGGGGATGANSFQASFQGSSSSSSGNGVSADISKNPFLNGAFGSTQLSGSKQISGSSITGSSASGNSIHGGSLSNSVSPLSLGSAAERRTTSSGNGCVGSPNGACQSGSLYINGQQTDQQQQVDISDVFGSGNFAASKAQGSGLTITCTTEGFVCVPISQCVNGLVNTNGAGALEARTREQYCKSSIETCCKLPAESNSVNVNQYRAETYKSSSSPGLTHIVGNAPRFGLETQFGGPNSLPNYQSNNHVASDSFVAASRNVYRPGSEPGQKPGVTYLPSYEETTSPPPYIPPQTLRTTTPPPYVPPRTTTPPPYVPPYVPPRTTTPPPYLPPRTTTPPPYVPPYVPPRTTTPPPYLPPRKVSTPAPSYLPYDVDSSNTSPTYVRPPVEETTGSLKLEPRITTQPPIVPVVPSGCAAALKCTPIEYCTAEGVISNTTVILTRDQAEFRVPLTDCKDVSGIFGKCCRDPTYTDPWPTGLIGKWDADIFGSGKYVPSENRGNTPRTPVRINPTTQPITGTTLISPHIVPNRGQFGGNRYQVVQGGGELSVTGQEGNYKAGGLTEQIGGYSEQQVQLQSYDAGSQCGIKRGQRPLGDRNELEVDFAEIPWQAMILLETNRSLLCGGVITRPDVVLTAAHCVDGLVAKNVLIKGGEWKLGIDEEPKPFQIVQVKHILRHPQYQPGNLLNDVAILVLTEKLRLADNIFPICLPGARESFESYYGGAGQCVVTGWGKQVLQVNVAGSILHELNVSLIRPNDCQSKISQEYPHLLEQYNTDSCVCGQPINPANTVCKVDIGSALACSNGDGHFVLRGVYSWDSGCQFGNQLAAFYKFDLDWYEWALGLASGGGRFTIPGQASFQQTQGGNVHSQQSGQRFDYNGANIRSQSNQGFGVKGQFNGVKQGHVSTTRKEYSQQEVTLHGNQGIQGGQLGIQGNLNGFNKQVAGLQQQIQKGGFVNGQTYHVKTQLPTVTSSFHSEERKVIQHPTITVNYQEKPRVVSNGQYSVSYETSGSGQNPQYVAPGVSFNPGFQSVVKAHNHSDGQQCKCLENGK